MNVQRTLEKLEKLHTLILQKQTGSPTLLAKKLSISRTNLYIMLDELAALNLPCRYSRKFESFVYENDINKIFEHNKKIFELN